MKQSLLGEVAEHEETGSLYWLLCTLNFYLNCDRELRLQGVLKIAMDHCPYVSCPDSPLVFHSGPNALLTVVMYGESVWWAENCINLLQASATTCDNEPQYRKHQIQINILHSIRLRQCGQWLQPPSPITRLPQSLALNISQTSLLVQNPTAFTLSIKIERITSSISFVTTGPHRVHGPSPTNSPHNLVVYHCE